MNSGAGDTTQLVPGFPIRTPWDHSSVDSSPRPIAASHVLHRLLVPRHPPYALSNLTTQNKMLASTVQFSTNTQPTPPHDDQTTTTARYHRRCRSPDTTRHTRRRRCWLPQNPNRMLAHDPPTTAPDPFHTPTGHPRRDNPARGSTSRRTPAARRAFASVSAIEHPTTTLGRCGLLDRRDDGQALLSKEVIQPHLPVRLPCYDFVPIASPTFDGSLP